MKLSRLFAIVRKEVRQLRRDRLTFGMIVGIPIFELLLFGYAINTDVRNLKTIIVDQANTHLSREFIQRLAQTQVVDIVDSKTTVQDLERELTRGAVSIGVYLPADFDRRGARCGSSGGSSLSGWQ